MKIEFMYQFLMQFQANILNVDIIIPKVAETTALGACFAAGLAVGYWKSLDDIREKWQVHKMQCLFSNLLNCRYHGCMDQEGIDRRIKGWRKAIEKSLNWVDEQLYGYFYYLYNDLFCLILNK